MTTECAPWRRWIVWNSTGTIGGFRAMLAKPRLLSAGFRVLLRRLLKPGDEATWGFIRATATASEARPQVIRTKGGLDRGASYEFQVQALGRDGKTVTHNSNILTVATIMSEVKNIGANAGSDHIDVWVSWDQC